MRRVSWIMFATLLISALSVPVSADVQGTADVYGSVGSYITGEACTNSTTVMDVARTVSTLKYYDPVTQEERTRDDDDVTEYSCVTCTAWAYDWDPVEGADYYAVYGNHTWTFDDGDNWDWDTSSDVLYI